MFILRRQQSSGAALLDILKPCAGGFLAKRAAIGDPLRKWALVLAPPIGVTIATATAAARLTLGATRHHGASECPRVQLSSHAISRLQQHHPVEVAQLAIPVEKRAYLRRREVPQSRMLGPRR